MNSSDKPDRPYETFFFLSCTVADESLVALKPLPARSSTQLPAAFSLVSHRQREMSETPPYWVDTVPAVPFGCDSDLVAMLREAQDCMSARMSGCSSVLCPASPEPEPFPLNWDSLPTILPPPHWNLPASPPHSDPKLKPATYKESSGQEGAAARYEKIVFTLLITNFFSLILGAGIGIWMFRKKVNVNAFM